MKTDLHHVDRPGYPFIQDLRSSLGLGAGLDGALEGLVPGGHVMTRQSNQAGGGAEEDTRPGTRSRPPPSAPPAAPPARSPGLHGRLASREV